MTVPSPVKYVMESSTSSAPKNKKVSPVEPKSKDSKKRRSSKRDAEGQVQAQPAQKLTKASEKPSQSKDEKSSKSREEKAKSKKRTRSEGEDKSSDKNSKKKAKCEKTSKGDSSHGVAKTPTSQFLGTDEAAIKKFRDAHRIYVHGDVTNFAPINQFASTKLAPDMYSILFFSFLSLR